MATKMSKKLVPLGKFLWLLLFGTFLTSTKASSVHSKLLDLLKSGDLYNFNVSSICSKQLNFFVSNLNELNEETLWAWKMVDSTSKMPSGILQGNFADLGHFDECTTINGAENIKGKYCLGRVKVKLSDESKFLQFLQPPTINGAFLAEHRSGDSTGHIPGAQWAACFPDGCKSEEMEHIYNKIIKEHTPNNIAVTLSFEEKLCQTSDEVHPKLDPGAITTISIFVIIVLLMSISTLYDYYVKRTKKEPPHLILLAFSVLENGRKLFKITKTPDQFPCLNGLRVFSMMWVILGHQYSNIRTVAVANSLAQLEWGNSVHCMLLLGASVSVDTFFLMSGSLVVYGFLKAMHQNVSFNVPKYWLHRFLRLTPALAAIVLVTATLMKYVISGPKWPEALHIPNECVQYWWSTLLYIQNYVNVRTMCLGHTWYLSVDMQLFVLSPLILVPLWKSKKWGLILLYLLIIISMVIPFTVAWVYDIKFTIVDANMDDYNNKYYFISHTRTTPWFIGILLGYHLYQIRRTKQVIKWNGFFVVFMWIASLAVLTTCVFGGHSMMISEKYEKWAHVMYITFVRPAWAVALCWVIVACTVGYGGPINWFLSLPIHQILGRFTYSLYLLHPFIITTKFMSSRIPMYFSDFELMYTFWGTMIFTLAASLFWILAFESPMIVIEKALFHIKTKRKLEDVTTKT